MAAVGMTMGTSRRMRNGMADGVANDMSGAMGVAPMSFGRACHGDHSGRHGNQYEETHLVDPCLLVHDVCRN